MLIVGTRGLWKNVPPSLVAKLAIFVLGQQIQQKSDYLSSFTDKDFGGRLVAKYAKILENDVRIAGIGETEEKNFYKELIANRHISYPEAKV